MSSSFRPAVPTNGPDLQHRQQMAAAINNMLQGHLNCTFQLTLKISTSSETVWDARINVNSFLGFMPQTANAAAEIGNGTLYAVCENGFATVSHASNTQADRTYTVCVIG